MPNIILRKLTTGDVASYHQITSDEAVMQYITGAVYTFDETEEEVHRLVNRFRDHPVLGVWVIIHRDSMQFVGLGALIGNSEAEAHIGFRVRPQLWGRGYGTSIARHLLQLAMEGGIHKISARVDEANLPSRKIFKALGFTWVGCENNEWDREDLIFEKILPDEKTEPKKRENEKV